MSPRMFYLNEFGAFLLKFVRQLFNERILFGAGAAHIPTRWAKSSMTTAVNVAFLVCVRGLPSDPATTQTKGRKSKAQDNYIAGI